YRPVSYVAKVKQTATNRIDSTLTSSAARGSSPSASPSTSPARRFGALAPSAALLILGRAVQGVGGAMIFGTGVAILTSVFPPQRRGWVLGINAAADLYRPVAGARSSAACSPTPGLALRCSCCNVPLGLLVAGRRAAAGCKRRVGRLPAASPSTGRARSATGLMLTAFMLGFTWLPGWRGRAAAGRRRRPCPSFIALGVAQRPPDLPGAPRPRQHASSPSPTWRR
ncbi:MAG: hypothetical protein M0C28_11485, partial [Candidatus Moduliflexus flocculans]|nr:hypothetical protein [Candidatus Moduliflexus flocculans]